MNFADESIGSRRDILKSERFIGVENFERGFRDKAVEIGEVVWCGLPLRKILRISTREMRGSNCILWLGFWGVEWSCWLMYEGLAWESLFLQGEKRKVYISPLKSTTNLLRYRVSRFLIAIYMGPVAGLIILPGYPGCEQTNRAITVAPIAWVFPSIYLYKKFPACAF